MNKANKFFKMSIMSLLLIGAIFSCKSSKKVSETTKLTPKTEVEEQKPEPAPEVKTKTERELTAEQLNNYFNAIVSASGNATTANRNINETKSLFASADAVVLIIISNTDGVKDYDEPTDITKYLNYLKDQGKNLNKIHDFKTDANGKITELELIRK